MTATVTTTNARPQCNVYEAEFTNDFTTSLFKTVPEKKNNFSVNVQNAV